MRHRCLPLFFLGLLAAPRLALAAGGACDSANVRWSATSDRLYLSGDVTCTLTDLRRLAPAEVPLELVDPTSRTWLLGTNLILEEGATLVVDGSPAGDVGELRLKSDSSSFVEVRAEWGTITIRDTRVTSWDEGKDGPDTEYETGRALIRALSYLDVDGETPRTSRMDIANSDIGYLGYYASESYGLVWKVRGETEEIFATIDVGGDITDSTIHHNYFGMYSFGAYGMNIARNEFHDNVMYGVDPHDDSDSLVIEDNYVHHNGNHGIICSKRCDNLIIRNNTTSFNAQTGLMLHRDVRDSVVEGNVAEGNADAGFAIMDSHDNILRNNIARDNKYGLRFSVGASDNLAEGNVVTGSTLYGIYMYMGTDPPTINDGRPARNRFVNNEVTGNVTAIKAGDAYANEFVGNVFADNGVEALLSDTEDNVFSGNDLGGSCLHVSGVASDVVADSEHTEVWLGSADAEMRFADSTGRVFDTSSGLSTTIDGEGSHLTLTGPQAGIVAVRSLDLAVAPLGGDVEVRVDAWRTWSRTWSTVPGTSGRARFTVGELVPKVRYVLWIDGARQGVHTADADGQLSFSADIAAEHTFSLVSSRRQTSPTWTLGR